MESGAEYTSGYNVLRKKLSSDSDLPSSLKLRIGTEMAGGDIHDDVGGGGGVGPSGGANEAGGNTYRDVCGGGGGFLGQINLQPFDVFPSTIAYKPPLGAGAGAGAGGMEYPFTTAQLKELERQAMIYKCLISSVTLPPHLLPPLHSSFSCKFLSPSLSLSVYPPLYVDWFLLVCEAVCNCRCSKNGDPEPGRCKRTDGKKWRCAREVAPHQKYCERHLHRGRPRSRKPVELQTPSQNHKKTRLDHSKSISASSLLLNPQSDLTLLDRNEQQPPPWGSESDCYIPQEYLEPLDHVLSYANYPAMEMELPMDAWWMDNHNLNSRSYGSIKPSYERELSPSLNLSMAMAAGNIVDREMRNILMDSTSHLEDNTKDSMWLSPVSWGGGGPLGEALQPASPSGVLHWTLFSNSDSSVCNSPTCVPPPP